MVRKIPECPGHDRVEIGDRRQRERGCRRFAGYHSLENPGSPGEGLPAARDEDQVEAPPREDHDAAGSN